MCLGMAIRAAAAGGLLTKSGSTNNTSSASTAQKKKKKKASPRNASMRGGAGNRSMFGDKENQDANG
jgi:hypothetical protein